MLSSLRITVLLIFSICVAKAQEPSFHYPIDNRAHAVEQAEFAENIAPILYLESSLPIGQIAKKQKDFKVWEGKVFLPQQAVWFQTTIFNTLKKQQDWVFHFGDGEVNEVHLVYENGIYHNFQLPQRNQLNLPNNSFELSIPADQAVNIYILAQSAKPKCQVETPQAWLVRYKSEQSRENMLIGFGVVILSVGLALLWWRFRKSRK